MALEAKSTSETPSTARAEGAALSSHAPATKQGSWGFLIVFLLTAGVIVVLGFGANVVGNSLELFPSKIRPSMGERAWKSRRLDESAKRNTRADVIVMGSSRMMQINPAYVEAITGGKAFNYGVSAAGPVDFLTQLQYLLALKYKPKLVLLGLDESAFAAVTSQYELQTVAHWGLFRQAPFPENVELLTRALGNVTPETTWNSILNVWDGKIPRNRKLRRVDNVLLENGYNIYVKRAMAADEGRPEDGASASEQLKWALEIQKTREADLARAIDVWRKRMGSGLAASGRRALEPQERHLKLFTEFLQTAKANGIEVRVLLLPLHPEFEKQALSADMLEDREKLNGQLSGICAAAGVKYRDFRRLESYGGSLEEWWDGSHQTPENLRRMTNAAFDRPPAETVATVKSDGFILRHLGRGKGALITTLNTY